MGVQCSPCLGGLERQLLLAKQPQMAVLSDQGLRQQTMGVQGSPYLGGTSRCDSTTMGVQGSPYLGGTSRCDSATMGVHFTIDIFDDEAFQNNGKAYQTKNLSHILNVPADKMGLPFDDEEHFYKWLVKNHNPQIAKGNFVPRLLYRAYLQEIISELKKNSSLKFVQSQISQIKFIDKKYVLANKDKVYQDYDAVVVACGLKVKKLNQDFQSQKIVDNIWQFFNQTQPQQSGTFLIIGTGLTMIDAVLSLKNSGFEGKIIACSGSAKLPLPHSKARTKAIKTLEISDTNLPLSQILHRLKTAGRKAEDWRDIIHGLRSITQELWQAFSPNKKRQFLRHLMSLWSIHRHRVAKENNDQIMEMIESGKLQIVKGRLKKLEEKNQQIFATLNNQKTVTADLVLNAMGFDFSGRTSVLLSNLVEEKIITHHKTGLGFEVLKNHPNFYLAGGLLTGELLEITAVPELRIFAHQIALKISSL